MSILLTHFARLFGATSVLVALLGNLCFAQTRNAPGAIQSGGRTPMGTPSPADDIRTDYTVEDGLPDNVVDAIVETENGLLWVCRSHIGSIH